MSASGSSGGLSYTLLNYGLWSTGGSGYPVAAVTISGIT